MIHSLGFQLLCPSVSGDVILLPWKTCREPTNTLRVSGIYNTLVSPAALGKICKSYKERSSPFLLVSHLFLVLSAGKTKQ